MNNLEILLKRLGSLEIINEASSETNKRLDKEMSITLAPVTMNNNI